MTENELKEMREQIDFWYETMAITFRQLGAYDSLFDEVKRLRGVLDKMAYAKYPAFMEFQDIAREALED